VQADGTETLVGLDSVELAEDGRIARVVPGPGGFDRDVDGHACWHAGREEVGRSTRPLRR